MNDSSWLLPLLGRSVIQISTYRPVVLLVRLNVVLPAAVLEPCSTVKVLSAEGDGLLPISRSTWVQQFVPNRTTTWVSRTCLPMSRMSPVPFFRFPKVG